MFDSSIIHITNHFDAPVARCGRCVNYPARNSCVLPYHFKLLKYLKSSDFCTACVATLTPLEHLAHTEL